MKTKRYAVGLGLAAAALLGIAAASLVRAPAQVADDPVGVLEAVHYAWSGSAYDVPVQPDTGEHVAVTVNFAIDFPPGGPRQVVGWVDVDWNGSNWVLSNAYAPAGIAGYTICSAEDCGSQVDPHGYGYKLQVGTQPPIGYHTSLVEFLVSSVDDGYTLTGSPCDQDTLVSNPPPYVFGVTDTGPFETLPDCANSGATLAIPYE